MIPMDSRREPAHAEAPTTPERSWYRSVSDEGLDRPLTTSIPAKGAGKTYQGHYFSLKQFRDLDALTDLAAEVIQKEPGAVVALLKSGSPAEVNALRERLAASNAQILSGFTQKLLIANIRDCGLLFAGMYNAGFTGCVRKGQTFRDLTIIANYALRAVSSAAGHNALGPQSNPMDEFLDLPGMEKGPLKFKPSC